MIFEYPSYIFSYSIIVGLAYLWHLSGYFSSEWIIITYIGCSTGTRTNNKKQCTLLTFVRYFHSVRIEQIKLRFSCFLNYFCISLNFWDEKINFSLCLLCGPGICNQLMIFFRKLSKMWKNLEKKLFLAQSRRNTKIAQKSVAC